jgi:hypothetical protein
MYISKFYSRTPFKLIFQHMYVHTVIVAALKESVGLKSFEKSPYTNVAGIRIYIHVVYAGVR